MDAVMVASRLIRSAVANFQLVSCAHCGGHDGVRKLLRIHPGCTLTLTPTKDASAEIRCRDCRQLNYVVPKTKTA